jgi:hypothetical protein
LKGDLAFFCKTKHCEPRNPEPDPEFLEMLYPDPYIVIFASLKASALRAPVFFRLINAHINALSGSAFNLSPKNVMLKKLKKLLTVIIDINILNISG